MSIRLRLILAFSACLMAAAVLICAIVFSYVKTSEEAAFHDLAVSQLERVEERIELFLEPGIKSAMYLASLDVVRSSRGTLNSYANTDRPTILYSYDYTPQAKLIYDEFERMARTNSDFSLIFMGNEDGQFVQAPEGLRKPEGYDPRNRPWYREAINSNVDLFISSPYLSSDNSMVCSILIKTYDEMGKFLGVLGIDYNLQSMLGNLAARRILKTGYLVVTDASGRVISDGRYPGEGLTESKGDIPELWTLALRSHNSSFAGAMPDGTEKYVVTNTIESLGWKVLVVFDRDELLASSYHILNMMLLSGLAVMGLIIITGSLLARSIVHPMEQLVDASKIISSGEHERSAEVRTRLESLLAAKGRGETGELAQALATVIKTLEQRIEDAMQGSRAKSDFLANISHEIRTPMNAIVGFTHLLLKSDLNPKQRDYAEKIHRSTRALLGIIADILDFSRLETGSLATQRAPFSLNDVISQITEMFRERSAASRIPLLIEIPPQIPRYLTGDSERLTQVLASLVDNAFKFTERGSITLTVRRPEEGEAQNGDTEASPLPPSPTSEFLLQFCVADTGIGMTQEQIINAFKAFDQADMSSTRKYGGIGLGLTITQSLVHLMGGDIKIISEPGQGTAVLFTCKFRLDLSRDDAFEAAGEVEEWNPTNWRAPACRAATESIALDMEANKEDSSPGAASAPDAVKAAQAEPCAPAGSDNHDDYSDLKGFRVLLVEDNELNIIIAEEFLREVGIEVTTARNGQEALARIDEAAAEGLDPAFDIVLMDLQMPVMDGYEAAKRLRYNHKYDNMVIIAMTAHAMEEERQRCLDCGMNEHLTKPIDVRQLYATLRRFLIKARG